MIALGFSISCSEKSGSVRGILIEDSEQSALIPLIAWATFDYIGTDICKISPSEGIPLKKGTRVEVLEESTCSQTIFSEENGELSTLLTGLSKIRFPSINNTGNASSGTFNEIWALNSTIQIIEEKFSSVGRTEQSNSDRNRERKLLKQQTEEKNAQREKNAQK